MNILTGLAHSATRTHHTEADGSIAHIAVVRHVQKPAWETKNSKGETRMFELSVDGKTYKVEFRHVTTLGKRKQLYARAPFDAITTCVVVADNFIAIDNSICAIGDNFSRIEGRLRSLRKVLKHCRLLVGSRNNLWQKFLEQSNIPKEQWTNFDSPELLKKKVQASGISIQEKFDRIDAGASVREARATAKSAASQQ